MIISLAYLAIQIRQNTRQIGEQSREMRIAAIDSIANSFSRFRDPLIRDPELAALWLRGLDDYRRLEPIEKVRLGRLLQELFFAHQNTWSRYQEGAMAEDAWEDHQQAIAGNLRNTGIQHWWQENRSIYADDFEVVVEDILRTVDTTSAPEPTL